MLTIQSLRRILTPPPPNTDYFLSALGPAADGNSLVTSLYPWFFFSGTKKDPDLAVPRSLNLSLFSFLLLLLSLRAFGNQITQ